MRKLTLITALLPALLACPPEQRETVVTRDAEVVVKAPDKGPDTLRGTRVMVEDDGPWKQRRLASAGPAGSKGSARGGKVRSRVLEGAAPPPSAMPMREMAAGEPAAAPTDLGGRPSKPGGRGAGSAGGGETVTGAGFGAALQDKSAPAAPPAAALKAGSTDDNADFDQFLEFLAQWSDRPDTAGKQQLLDVRDRRYVKVLDQQGKPVPAAEVELRGAGSGRVIYAGTTYGDGAVPFYPRVCDRGRADGDVLVEVRYGGQRVSKPWPETAHSAGSTLEVTLPVARQMPAVVALDVLFIIDTTGSMGDEIAQIKSSLLAVTAKLRSLQQEFDLRYGAVLYRDVTDEYLTATHAFTGDIEAFDRALKQVSADGGGDGPESLNQGLAQAMHGVQWRPGAAKVAFLIADAEPHMDYQDDVPYGESLKDAVALGVRIHSVAASGLGPFGTLVFRQTAQFARGKFIFIEYGSTAASAAQHGVTGQVQGNNLDDIIFRQLSWEVASWGRP